MHLRRRLLHLSPLLSLLLAVACETTSATDDAGVGDPDAGTGRADTAAPPSTDAGTEPPADASGDQGPTTPAQAEKEPNDGTTPSEVNAFTIPGSITGAIDPKGDNDIFSITLKPGELWEWTLTPDGADLAPHLTVFDTGGKSPNVLTTAPAGTAASLTHFVLADGTWTAAVRDARNVGGSATEGGPSFKYTLKATKKTPAPKTIASPSKTTGKLASLYSIDLYTFVLASDTALDVMIHAAQKTPASTLDSRLSLFETSANTWVGTNDDVGPSNTDSKLGGTLPAGTYVAIVENEGTNDADLSYEIEIALR
jgi:hypothetical protein